MDRPLQSPKRYKKFNAMETAMNRFLVTCMLTACCVLAMPAASWAQFSIQTSDFGLTVGPNGGVGVRLGAPAVPPPPPPVYVAPAPVVVVAPAPRVVPPPVVVPYQRPVVVAPAPVVVATPVVVVR